MALRELAASLIVRAGQSLGASGGLGGSGAGGGLGGGLPSSGISGDVTAAAEMARRLFEQQAIDGGDMTQFRWNWISEWRARQIVPLTAGLRLITGTIMQMPLKQYRGDQEVIPPATIVRIPAPAENGTLAMYVDGYAEDVTLYGNHVCILGEPDSTGWPASLLPVDVTKVAVARDLRGRKVYTYDDLGSEQYLTDADILHVALDVRSGELVGRGLIPTMASTLYAAAAAEDYAGRYFDESALPTGVITDNRPDLSQGQADDLKSAWLRTVGGRRRVPIVLPQTTTFQPLVTNADEAQLVQARQWNSALVAMAIGVPPFMLGIETEKHVYTNAENEFGRFIRTTIMRLLVPWEQKVNLQCLPAGNNVTFDTSSLLRPEAAARFSMAIQGYQAHLLTEGEARELMGYSAEGGPGIGPSDALGEDLQPQLTVQLPTAPPAAAPDTAVAIPGPVSDKETAG
jgi:HK97 family phage portal protein